MACRRLPDGSIVCGPDAFGEAKVGGRTYRWDFHHYMGPLFVRKDGIATEFIDTSAVAGAPKE